LTRERDFSQSGTTHHIANECSVVDISTASNLLSHINKFKKAEIYI